MGSHVVAPLLQALFCFGTGALAEGYQWTLVDRNASQYSILPLGKKQLAKGSNIVEFSHRNNLPLVLYDVEGDPNFRLVREAYSLLSLTVQLRPHRPPNNNGFFSVMTLKA
jgi:hypothetical protein